MVEKINNNTLCLYAFETLDNALGGWFKLNKPSGFKPIKPSGLFNLKHQPLALSRVIYNLVCFTCWHRPYYTLSTYIYLLTLRTV